MRRLTRVTRVLPSWVQRRPLWGVHCPVCPYVPVRRSHAESMVLTRMHNGMLHRGQPVASVQLMSRPRDLVATDLTGAVTRAVCAEDIEALDGPGGATEPEARDLEAPSFEDVWAVGPAAVLTHVDQGNLRRRANWHPDGVLATPILGDLTDAEHYEAAAIHEAGHAVVGILVGHRLEEIAADADPACRARMVYAGTPTDLATADQPGGSYVRWGPYDLPLEGHLAMCWAGQRAQRRWFADRGQLTADVETDLRVAGWHDAAQVLLATRQADLPSDFGMDLADELITEHWPAIVEVAAAVQITGRLDGTAVHAFLAGWCR